MERTTDILTNTSQAIASPDGSRANLESEHELHRSGAHDACPCTKGRPILSV